MLKKHAQHRVLIGVSFIAALSMAVSACGDGGGNGDGGNGGSEGGDGDLSGSVAFLMPDHASTRYEEQDYPLFEAKIQELCPDCEVHYQNADGNATDQQEQADSMAARGVDVVVIDAVDTTAAANIVENLQAQDIKVITYDRPVPNAQADYYVSFDNTAIGELISEDLVTYLADEGVTADDGGLLIVGGSPDDDAAQLIKEGMMSGVEASDFEVLASFDTPDWDPPQAQEWVDGQLDKFGSDVVGVVAANDGTGGAAIAALKAAGLTPLPPVTGNDAETAAIQRIINGDQHNTISKPIKIVAEKTAEIVVQMLQGDTPEGEETLFDTPSVLFVPEVVTRENVKEIIFDGGIYTADEICTSDYESACEELGIL